MLWDREGSRALVIVQRGISERQNAITFISIWQGSFS